MFGADRPKTVTVKCMVTGTKVSKITNVSLNTLYVSLPHIIADALVRGFGTGGWDIHGEWDSTEEAARESIAEWFHGSYKWWDDLDRTGESILHDLKLTMTE